MEYTNTNTFFAQPDMDQYLNDHFMAEQQEQQQQNQMTMNGCYMDQQDQEMWMSTITPFDPSTPSTSGMEDNNSTIMMGPKWRDDRKCTNCHVTTTSLWRRDRDGRTVCNACGLYEKHNNAKRPMKKAIVRKNTKQASIGECFNCKTNCTSMWRRDKHDRKLCNSCGLYQKTHNMDRPVEMKKDTPRRRNRVTKKNDVSEVENLENVAPRRRFEIVDYSGVQYNRMQQQGYQPYVQQKQHDHPHQQQLHVHYPDQQQFQPQPQDQQYDQQYQQYYQPHQYNQQQDRQGYYYPMMDNNNQINY